MRFDLPTPLRQYFADGERDANADLFAPNAVVLDEGRAHRGRRQIADWLHSVEQRYRPRYELLDASRDGARTLVTFKVSGIFPGSPATLRQALVTENDKIVSLETL